MATERTAMTPFGGVVYVDTESETYMHPFAEVVHGDIEAAGGGGITIPIVMHHKQIQRG